MATIKSGATPDQLTVDPTSKAARTTLYDALGRELSIGSKAAYMASSTFTPAATPTDLVTIFGSATKLVRVLAMLIGTNNTAPGSQQFMLVKRSAANSGGTFVPVVGVPMDSSDAGASAVAGHYTANATSLGAAVGTLNTKRIASPIAIPASFAGIAFDASVDLLNIGSDSGRTLARQLVLRGVAQGLVINFNGAALVAGQTHAYTIFWIEE